MINSGDLAIFHPDGKGYAHRDGEIVMVLFCIDQNPKPNGHDPAFLDRLFQVKTRDACLLMAFESELTQCRVVESAA